MNYQIYISEGCAPKRESTCVVLGPYRRATARHAATDAPNMLHEVARGAGASTRTIERLFRDETGLSFGAWRQRARLARALQLLADDATVTQAAIAVGYESVSAFVAAFRRTVGITPGQYFR